MKSIELYENQMFDIQFEDTREIITVNDTKAAEVIKHSIESLFNEAVKFKKESQGPGNNLLYRSGATSHTSSRPKGQS